MTNSPYTFADFVAYKRGRIASWLEKAKDARKSGDRRRFFYCMHVLRLNHGSLVASKNALDGDFRGAADDFMEARPAHPFGFNV